MKSDTLRYNTNTKISTFFGPTTIKSDEDFLYSENGTYNTKTDVAQFTKNAYYQTESRKLNGDKLYYDRKKGIGRATGHVVFTDTAQKVIIHSEKANYNKVTETVVATDKAYVTMLIGKDSLFLSADTLKSITDTATKLRTLYAYHDARIFKSDLRARCDSLVYTDRDSTMSCYKDPVMWSKNAQLTADFLTFNIKNEQLHKMNMYTAAFVIMIDSLDSTKFDQVRGKNMFGYFIDNDLVQLDVEGNGQSIYYAKEDSADYIGVNSAECSNMIIRFSENRVQKVTFITQPDAVFYPLDEVTPEELKLKGFSWREALKPKSKEDILH
jgi:lipopolysaccharide export system protein LptA